MSESRQRFLKYRNHMTTTAAALTILPFWYPLFEKSLYQRAQILQSKYPGDLSHSTLFNNKVNYYRGVSTNILTMLPLFPAVEWVLSSLLKNIANYQHRDPNFVEKFSAGFLTGSMTAVIANPYEATNISAQQYRESLSKSFVRIAKTSGSIGFYRGFIPMSLRNGFFVSSLLVTTPEIKSNLAKMLPLTGTTNYLASTVLCAGIPATLFTCLVVPFDIAAIMRQSDPSKYAFKSTSHALKKAFNKHGLAALKTGTLFRLAACNIEMIGFNFIKEKYDDLASHSYRT